VTPIGRVSLRLAVSCPHLEAPRWPQAVTSATAAPLAAPAAFADFDIPPLSHEFEIPPISFQGAGDPLEPVDLEFNRSHNTGGDRFEFDEPIKLFSGLF
jgi:hypothetical protein